MKSIGNAAELVRKAVGALRGKAGVLRARLLFLASLRRRMAVVAGISRHIRALAPRQQKAAEEDAGDEHLVGVPELARLFEQVADEDGHGDWALTLRSLFDDEGISERCAVVDGLDDDDEASVMDVIRSRRKGDGGEFRIEDEIDEAADMYITRVRRRIVNAERAAQACCS